MSSTQEQQKAIEDFEHQYQYIQASAGSGKTYTIIEKVKNAIQKGLKPDEILLFSFSKKATEELNERLISQDIPPVATTFHSFAHRVLSKGKYLERLGFKSGYNIISEFSPQVKDDLEKEMKSAYLLNFSDELLQSLENSLSYDLLLELVKKIVSFELFPIEPFEKFKHYQLIIVDEFQDTTYDEMCILKGLMQKYTQINFVGDEKQALYRFRNEKLTEDDLKTSLIKSQDTLALVTYAFGIEKKEIFTHHLTYNFRSGNEIVNFANQLFSNLHEKAAQEKNAYIKDLQDEKKTFYETVKEVARPGIKIGILMKTNQQVFNTFSEITREAQKEGEKFYINYKVSQQPPTVLSYKKSLLAFFAQEEKNSCTEFLKQKEETIALNIDDLLKKYFELKNILSHGESFEKFTKLYDLNFCQQTIAEMIETIAEAIDLPEELVGIAFIKNYPQHYFIADFLELMKRKSQILKLKEHVENIDEKLNIQLLEQFEEYLLTLPNNKAFSEQIELYFKENKFEMLLENEINTLKQNPQIEISTIHMSKGGEYDIVITNENIKNIERVIRTKEAKETFNDNIYTQYVVITRAKEGLIFI